MMEFVCDLFENKEGKGEKKSLATSILIFLNHCLQKPFSLGSLNWYHTTQSFDDLYILGICKQSRKRRKC